MQHGHLADTEEPTPFELKVRRGVKRGRPIRVVEISYSPSPDADQRLAQALHMLLRAAARDGDDALHTKTDGQKGVNDG